MSDKTQLVNIQKYLMGQPIDIINDDDGEYYLSTESALELAQQILDICQPQWIPVTERLPDAEPHRTIEIACISPYPDDEKAPYSIHVSTRFPVTEFEGSYAWREVVLPPPPLPPPEDTA